MRTSTTVKVTSALSWIVGLILAIMPFHAFLTVWLSSGIGSYTLLRLWKEILLLVLVSGCIYLLAIDSNLRKKIFSSTISKLVLIYSSLMAIWGITAYGLGKVSLKALGFGAVVNLRFLLFFIAVWIIATKSQILREIWPKIILIPAAFVILIGFVQRFVLPYDVLKHFGYGPQTIYAYQTVNHDPNYPRIMSTLRGANPLGAYLVLILNIITVLGLAAKKKLWLWGLFMASALLALFLSYSRAAWIGLLLSWLLLAWLLLKKQVKRIALVVLVLLLAFSVGFVLALQGNSAFENAIFHTSDKSSVKVSSNQEHLTNFKNGISDLATEPLGRGLGTAGPASVYNEEGEGRISENYFIQIGQEVGWLGLGLFLAIYFLVARELWLRQRDSLALALLVSLVGLTAINLLSHAWTDDTIAYLWWGLAGIALARKTKNN